MAISCSIERGAQSALRRCSPILRNRRGSIQLFARVLDPAQTRVSWTNARRAVRFPSLSERPTLFEALREICKSTNRRRTQCALPEGTPGARPGTLCLSSARAVARVWLHRQGRRVRFAHQREIQQSLVPAGHPTVASTPYAGGMTLAPGVTCVILAGTSASTLPNAQLSPPSTICWNFGLLHTSSRCPIEV
jgi:hypothetical protein